MESPSTKRNPAMISAVRTASGQLSLVGERHRPRVQRDLFRVGKDMPARERVAHGVSQQRAGRGAVAGLEGAAARGETDAIF